MKRIRLYVFSFIALALFVAGLGIRRSVLRSHMDELQYSIQTMKEQEELEEKMNDLMTTLMKSDAELRDLVISRDSLNLNGFDSQLAELDVLFDSFLDLAVSHEVLAARDTMRIDSLVERELLFMSKIKNLCDEKRYDEAAISLSSEPGKVLINRIWNIFHLSDSTLNLKILASEQEYDSQSKKEASFSLFSFAALIIALFTFLFFLFREIGKNELIKEQLSEREEKLSVTLAGISDGVLTTDVKGYINYLNPVAEKLLACPLEKASGKHLDEVYRITDEKSGKCIDDIFEQVVIKGKEIETRNHTILRTFENESYVIENSATPMRNYDDNIIGMVLVFRDVTEQRDNTLARLEAEKDFRVIFENTQEGIYRSTMDGQLLLVNPSMTRIFEFESPEQMVKGVNDIGRQLFLDGDTRELVVSKLINKGRIIGFEFQTRTQKEKSIWIRLNAHLAYKENGEVDYVEGSVTDITQHRIDQENLKKQYDALREYAFINSHEVRSHVATMLGLMNLCNAKYVSDQEREKIMKYLNEETLQLDKVIRKLSVIINE